MAKRKSESQEPISNLTKEEEELIRELRSKRSIEQKFQEAVKSSTDQIKPLVTQAEELLIRAVEISTETGIPFSWLREVYTPDTFFSKWKKPISNDNVIIGALEEYDCLPYDITIQGWTSSSDLC